eukprot:TRINITY_DN63390_c0_g1_i1.p1 TRINITY_DN63390_c0_g1~~TRINITY_DN63390_c0_g1_i1.p1  ORF type:complete len:235 (+),score=37.30 TRINITY_DN63390_c0_g1_i1:85-789(+)
MLEHTDRTFSDGQSEVQSSQLSQESFYSDFGTAMSMNSEVTCSLRDSSINSFPWEMPELAETIVDSQLPLDVPNARSLEHALSAPQSERVRFRRPFPASRNSSFSRSSLGSCNMYGSLTDASFLKDLDDGDELKISSIPEDEYAVSTADTLLYRVDPAEVEGRDLIQQASFASLGAGETFDVGDGSFIDDWPTRDAKVRFSFNDNVAKESAHRRDSILVDAAVSSQHVNAVGAV